MDMKPGDKAKELVNKYIPFADKKARVSGLSQALFGGSHLSMLLNQSGTTWNLKDQRESAKQCAIIAVNEILATNPEYVIEITDDNGNVSFMHSVFFWKSVKQSIQNES